MKITVIALVVLFAISFLFLVRTLWSEFKTLTTELKYKRNFSPHYNYQNLKDAEQAFAITLLITLIVYFLAVFFCLQFLNQFH